MNSALQKYVELNREVISSMFSFICSSGEQIMYIFLNGLAEKQPELLITARDESNGELDIKLVPAESGQEEIMRRCVGNGVKV